MDIVENSLYIDDLKYIAGILPDRKCSFLVTGATGLIGSCLIDALVYAKRSSGRDYRIYAMSRTKERLEQRFGYAGDDVTLIAHDVCDPLAEDTDFDYIINAASNADPRTYALYPAETIKTNILGVLNFLEYARAHKGTRVLFTSTMEVYGNTNSDEPKDEAEFGYMDFNSIRSGYPESKRTAELLCRSYNEEYGTDSVIARLGYIYGPTMTDTDNKAVAQFINKAVEGNDIVLKSEGLQRRSYCYVADAAAGILTVLFKGEAGEAYNIADAKSVVSIRELAEKAAEVAGRRVVFELPDELEKKGSSKPCDAVLAPDKLSALGCTAKTDIADGLGKTVCILREKRG